MRQLISHARTTIVVAAAALLALAGATPATAGDDRPSGQVESADSPQAIKGRYLVTLAEDTASTTSALADRYGATVTRTYPALSGFAAAMSESDAAALAADPAVARVTADEKINLDGVQPSPISPGLDRIDQRNLPLDGYYRYPDSAGENTTVYILDTGVRTTHADFGTRASSGYDFIDDDSDASDCNGHGTHLAATAAGSEYGVAKKADVVAVRVLDCDGSGTISGIVAGIDWVTQNASGTGNPAVANLALGGGVSQALDDAVASAVEAGVSYVVTAGNGSGDACQYSPARVPQALTVGGTDTSTDAVSGFSNRGPCVDLYAPATGISSAWYTSDTATQVLSGTSATAHASGALALYLSIHPDATPAQACAALVSEATPIPQPGGSPIGLLYTGFML